MKNVFIAHSCASMTGERYTALCRALGANEMLSWRRFGASLLVWSDDARELATVASEHGLEFGSTADRPEFYALAVYAGLI